MVLMRAIIKIKHNTLAGHIAPVTPLGFVTRWCPGDNAVAPPPEGWVDCDGRAYKRADYPDVAYEMRKNTSWWRWHVLRQFRVPDIPVQIGIDVGMP